MKDFKPEACYQKTNMHEEEIKVGTAVVGTAIGFDSKTRRLIVDLGYSCKGLIPEHEVSIYDLTYGEERYVPQQITSILGKQIRAIVTQVLDDSTFVLSRRESMIKAWEMLKEGNNYVGVVTNNIGYGVFLDIGNGLVTFLPKGECSATAIYDTRNWYKTGDKVTFKLLSKGGNPTHRIISSRRLMNTRKIRVGEIYSVRIGGSETQLLNGYFCEVTPYWAGIIDTTEQLQEGQIVKGIVRKITERGVKLNLIK